jgi:Icc protein
MNDVPLRIVQITDMHHFSDKNRALLGVNTHDSFIAVLDLLRADPIQPDLILLTGDLSQDETESSYLQVSDAIKDFPMPVYWLPGNHDSGKLMAHVYPRENISNLKHIVLEHWQLILLDSHIPGAVEGHLDHVQLKFMQHCLDMFPEHQAILVFHHQPIPVGCAWLDKLGLTNADEFWHILERYPRVNTILFGHVHQQHEGEKNGIKYFSTPSTCIQFKTNSDPFALDDLPPAYRWIDLFPNGELKTGVCRVAHYVGTFDKNATGY